MTENGLLEGPSIIDGVTRSNYGRLNRLSLLLILSTYLKYCKQRWSVLEELGQIIFFIYLCHVKMSAYQTEKSVNIFQHFLFFI